MILNRNQQVAETIPTEFFSIGGGTSETLLTARLLLLSVVIRFICSVSFFFRCYFSVSASNVNIYCENILTFFPYRRYSLILISRPKL